MSSVALLLRTVEPPPRKGEEPGSSPPRLEGESPPRLGGEALETEEQDAPSCRLSCPTKRLCCLLRALLSRTRLSSLARSAKELVRLASISPSCESTLRCTPKVLRRAPLRERPRRGLPPELMSELWRESAEPLMSRPMAAAAANSATRPAASASLLPSPPSTPSTSVSREMEVDRLSAQLWLPRRALMARDAGSGEARTAEIRRSAAAELSTELRPVTEPTVVRSVAVGRRPLCIEGEAMRAATSLVDDPRALASAESISSTCHHTHGAC